VFSLELLRFEFSGTPPPPHATRNSATINELTLPRFFLICANISDLLAANPLAYFYYKIVYDRMQTKSQKTCASWLLKRFNIFGLV
jgi:hypothetical protein